ncbi:peptidase [Prevotella aurantiaca]|jgi:arginine-specific protease argI polyprotein|uniref:Peptidase n=1 Tax=Prevotella aurantiaca TaxID=596085 RepID=A0A930HKH1_9BACT|nr:peptidase [Prevotella aurantiaca]MBF1383353.1 peptidase [Prevotella aurantiaca]
MVKKILKSMYVATAAMFVAMFAMPQNTLAQTEYALKIAGTKVTSLNCQDLSTIEGVSGTLSYNPDSKTLTMKNVTIKGATNEAIYSEIDGLKIRVLESNFVTAEFAAIAFRKPLTITGGGILNTESENMCCIYANEADLTIENCTVTAKSIIYGIAGFNGSSEHITIKNANVTAEGTERGSIVDIASLTLEGCNITQPSGATFDAAKHYVALDGKMVTSPVVITSSTGINSTSSDATTTAKATYTLSGTRMSGELKDLPKGIYIVNGKKVVKK